MAPINTTLAFAFSSEVVTDSDVVAISDFTGFTSGIINQANRAIISVVDGNVNVRWDGGDPTDAPGGGIAIIGSPATDVASNAVFIVDGGANVANLKFIKAVLQVGGGLDPAVSILLEE